MTHSGIDRRRLMQISTLAAASAAAVGPAQAQCADAGGTIFGYGLDGAPTDISAVEAFFPAAEFAYVWDGPASERYPSGNREVGTATVRPREDGAGVTYEIDAHRLS